MAPNGPKRQQIWNPLACSKRLGMGHEKKRSGSWSLINLSVLFLRACIENGGEKKAYHQERFSNEPVDRCSRGTVPNGLFHLGSTARRNGCPQHGTFFVSPFEFANLVTGSPKSGQRSKGGASETTMRSVPHEAPKRAK